MVILFVLILFIIVISDKVIYIIHSSEGKKRVKDKS